MNRQPINPPYQRAAYEVRFYNVPPMIDEFIVGQDAAMVVEAKLQYLKRGGFQKLTRAQRKAMINSCRAQLLALKLAS